MTFTFERWNWEATVPQKITVYIVRGLPGSGKSHVLSQIGLKALNQKKSVRYCSDDFHFVDNCGEYAWHKWNADKIAQARSETAAAFGAALSEGVHTICVDDVHSQVSSYENYAKQARVFGYNVVVLEILCPQLQHVQAFFGRSGKCAKRGKAGYLATDLLKMWKSWEVDPEAVRLQPTAELDATPNSLFLLAANALKTTIPMTPLPVAPRPKTPPRQLNIRAIDFDPRQSPWQPPRKPQYSIRLISPVCRVAAC